MKWLGKNMGWSIVRRKYTGTMNYILSHYSTPCNHRIFFMSVFPTLFLRILNKSSSSSRNMPKPAVTFCERQAPAESQLVVLSTQILRCSKRSGNCAAGPKELGPSSFPKAKIPQHWIYTHWISVYCSLWERENYPQKEHKISWADIQNYGPEVTIKFVFHWTKWKSHSFCGPVHSNTED